MLTRLLFACFVCTSLVSFGRAQTEGDTRERQRPTPAPRPITHTVSGIVREDRGQPVPESIPVNLKTLSGALVGQTFTNSIGGFEFRSIPNGVYILEVRSPDHPTTETSLEVYAQFGTIFRQDVFLPPRIKKHQDEVPVGFEGDNSSSTVSLENLGRKIPDKALREYERGVELSGQKKIQKAIPHFQKAIFIAPDFYQAHNNLGVQYLKLGQLDKASSAFDRAAELNPSGSFPHLNLGIVYGQKGELDRAQEYFERTLKLEETNASAHYYLGELFEKKKEYAKALEQFSRARALKLHPELYTQSCFRMGNLYAQLGQHELASPLLEEYLKSDPDPEVAARVKAYLEKQRVANEQPK